MNNNLTYWIFYSILSFNLILLINLLKLNIDAFQSFVGNIFIFIYTYMITYDFKFSVYFICIGYFISLYKN